VSAVVPLMMVKGRQLSPDDERYEFILTVAFLLLHFPPFRNTSCSLVDVARFVVNLRL